MFCFLFSCSPIYQVFEVSSSDVKSIDKSVVFENKEVKISYNFWSNGGRAYFKFTNKTDSELYIDWDKSHFIYNGISYEYWDDEEVSNSFYASSSSTSANTFANASANILGNSAYANSNSSSSVSVKKITAVSTTKVKPKKIIFLPAKSSLLVFKFTISASAYYNCNYNLKVMKSKSSKKVSFTKDNTPLEFRNQIIYSSDEKFINKVNIDNSFYISGVTFMSEKTFNGKITTEKDCNIQGSKSTATYNEFPYKKANSFYVIASRQ